MLLSNYDNIEIFKKGLFLSNFRMIKTNKKAKLRNKIFVFAITGFILAVLMFSAPANSYILNLTSDKTDVSKGGEITFNTGVSISSSESSNVQNLTLYLIGLNGISDYSCVFDVNGAVLSGCSGMIITRTGNLSYGYGYGYGYGASGTLSYKITLDTTNYNTGEYRTRLNVIINGNSYVQDGQTITISTRSNYGTLSGGYHYSSDGSSNNYDQICLNAWKCSEWSACDNGEETRTCAQTMANCLMTPKPAETQKCAITITKPDYYNGPGIGSFALGSNENVIRTESESITGNRNRFAGITGAVIGANALGNPLILALILLIAVLIGLILGIAIARALRRKRKINQLRRLNQIRYKPLK